MDIQIRSAKSEELEELIELQSKALRVLSVKDYTAKEIEIIVKTQATIRQYYKEIVFVAEQKTISNSPLTPRMREDRENNSQKHFNDAAAEVVEVQYKPITNNKIVGFSCLSSSAHNIGGVYIHPDYIRQKIGTKLLQAIEEVSISKKHKIIWVKSSLNAIRFYQSNGYTKHFFSRIWLDVNPIDIAIMSKPLVPLTASDKTQKNRILLREKARDTIMMIIFAIIFAIRIFLTILTIVTIVFFIISIILAF
ncbi:MAG: GNAT family N-acetyltransferase [Cyanobacteria bacterium P01_E01_bin.42]